MAKRTPSQPLTDEGLRSALAARAERLREFMSRRITDAPAHFSIAINDGRIPATPLAADALIPPIEPIWCFWLDAARLAEMTTAFAARQLNVPNASRRIPKFDLPPEVIAHLTAWFNDHGDGTRAAARAANYLAHYGLRLPTDRDRVVKSTPFLDAFHAVLLEAVRYKDAARPTDASVLLFYLRRLHIHLARTASLIVEGVDPSQIFQRLSESLALGRADFLVAQWLLALPEISAALRGHILVPYPEQWMPPHDRLRQLTRKLDSLSLFYFDLAATSEALLLSVRLGDWTQSPPAAATTWATFWYDDIARYLAAFEEVTSVRLAR